MLHVVLALTALITTAHADDDMQNWRSLHDALLVESVDGDLRGAVRAYERLVRTLPAHDRTYAEAVFWLARARYELGDADQARAALLDGIRTGSCRVRCFELLGRIEKEAYSVRELPTRWTFDSPDHGFIHPWSYDDLGTIRIEEIGSHGPVLVWATSVNVRRADRLVVSFRDLKGPGVSRIRFSFGATNLEPVIRLIAVDIHGRQFVADKGMRVPAGSTREVDVAVTDFVSVDGEKRALVPTELAELLLADVSALEGDTTGPTEYLIDNFEAL
jgi:hypothetical protein